MSRFVQTLATISLCVASFSTQLLPAQQVEKLEGLAFDYDHTGWISGFRYAAPGGEFADWLNGRSLKLATIAQITLEQHEILRSELEAIAKPGTLEVLVIGSYPDIVKLDDDAVEALGKINSLQELSIWAESTTTAKWQAIGDLQSCWLLVRLKPFIQRMVSLLCSCLQLVSMAGAFLHSSSV
ncbi:MAG TPA: hypothetical protein P5307_28465, partial [Pirellulaceae bacterium]|nr:hypothetical protein [Pirellulaceae bacterium]